MTLALSHLSMCVLCSGTSGSWPIDDAIGGLPAHITLRFAAVAPKGHGLDSNALREKTHAVMAASLKSVLAGYSTAPHRNTEPVKQS